MRTQVAVIGGGPSGLLLSQLLHLQGIETVVLEKHSRDYVLGRIRAGVLEHGFAALMREAKVGERMDREGQIHEGIYIAHDGVRERVDLKALTGGNSVIVYGQTELTRDLYEARDRLGGIVIHNADNVAPHDFDTARPYLTYRGVTRSFGSIATISSAATAFTASAGSRSRRTRSANSSASIRLAGWACFRARSRCRPS